MRFSNILKIATRFGTPVILEIMELADKLAAFKPLRGVYGNIDGERRKNYLSRTSAF